MAKIMEQLGQVRWDGTYSIPFHPFHFSPFFMDKQTLIQIVESRDSKHKKALFEYYYSLFQERNFSNAFISIWISKDLDGTAVDIESIKYIKRHFVKKMTLMDSIKNVITSKQNFNINVQEKSDASFDFRIKPPEPKKLN